MEKLKPVNNFEGKRNCVLTFFIPPLHYFKKDISKIEKTISSLKHENKKRQLKKVMRKFNEKTDDFFQYDENGMIICCGMDKMSEVFYYEFKSNKKIENFDYYFDYRFNINKIKEYLFEKYIKSLDKKETNEWLIKLEKLINDELIVYEKELKQYIELNLISHLLYLSNEAITDELLEKAINYNFQILVFDMLDRKNINNFSKYGKKLGVLYYKIDLN